MDKYTNAELAQVVREKNATLNDGRGCQVLRHAILWLEQDDRETAQHCCMTDHDKLAQYNIDAWLRDVGLFSDDYIAQLNRWKRKW